MVKTRLVELKERLRRNLVILDGVLGRNGKKVEIHRNILFKKGFDLKACTSAFRQSKKLFFEIGNYIFSYIEEGKIRIERLASLSEDMPVFFRRWEIDFPPGEELVGVVTG